VLGLCAVAGGAFFVVGSHQENAELVPRTLPAPVEGRVRVEVLNGGGVAGAARRATDLARGAGFDVVYFGNAASFGQVESEVVDRVGRPEFAQVVAEVLGIRNVRSEPDPDRYVDVSVVLGSEWSATREPDVAPMEP
jgi:hypothetical protein